MPLHDWTDPAGWEGMHLLWITELLRHIKPQLPAGYRAYIGSAPVVAVGGPTERPDVGVRQWPEEPKTATSTDSGSYVVMRSLLVEVTPSPAPACA